MWGLGWQGKDKDKGRGSGGGSGSCSFWHLSTVPWKTVDAWHFFCLPMSLRVVCGVLCLAVLLPFYFFKLFFERV